MFVFKIKYSLGLDISTDTLVTLNFKDIDFSKIEYIDASTNPYNPYAPKSTECISLCVDMNYLMDAKCNFTAIYYGKHRIDGYDIFGVTDVQIKEAKRNHELNKILSTEE